VSRGYKIFFVSNVKSYNETACPHHHISSLRNQNQTFIAEYLTPVFKYNTYSTLCLVSTSGGIVIAVKF